MKKTSFYYKKKNSVRFKIFSAIEDTIGNKVEYNQFEYMSIETAVWNCIYIFIVDVR